MLTLDQIRGAGWDELYLFLMNGNPPLILILLGINTLFFILYIFRRATHRHSMRSSTVYFVQGAVIVANTFALFSGDITRQIMSLKGIL